MITSLRDPNLQGLLADWPYGTHLLRLAARPVADLPKSTGASRDPFSPNLFNGHVDGSVHSIQTIGIRPNRWAGGL